MTRPLLLTLAVLVMLGTQSAHAATLPAGTTAILSGKSSLFDPLPAPVADSDSSQQSVSANGRFVAFTSESDGLSSEDNDSVDNVYVKDRLMGTVTLASRATGAAGAPAGDNCFDAAVSDDGRRVAFTCEGSLDPADTGDREDVYLRDLQDNQTFLVSRATQLGDAGDDQSFSPELSSDGTRVAFGSEATNLGGPADHTDAIYARDIPIGGGPAAANVTRLVSRADGLAGNLPNDDSFEPSISNNGDVIAFSSDASNLVGDDNNGFEDVFVRTVSTGATQLASRKDGAAGTPGDGHSFFAEIAGNGSVVVFESRAHNLDTVTHTSVDHVFKRILGATQDTVLVDQKGGTDLEAGGTIPVTDDTGATIAFASGTTTIDAADFNPLEDVYVAKGGQITLASRGNGPTGAPANTFQSPALSGDGKHLAFSTLGSLTGDAIPGVRSVEVRDFDNSATTTASKPGVAGTFDNAGGSSFGGSASADGRFVAFSTAAPALGVPTDVQFEVVVRDTATGAVVVASREDGPSGAPMPGSSFAPSISADGRRVAFETSTDGAGLFETSVASRRPQRARSPRGVLRDGKSQIWVRDLVTGQTVEASRPNVSTTEEGDAASFDPSISADGRHVEFLSDADNLIGGDGNHATDSFVRDLETNETVLASRADGADGDQADSSTFSAVMSADGRHVAFDSLADNLGDGAGGNNQESVHVRDLDAGTTRLASVAGDGHPATDAFEGSIDAHGNRVAFVSADSLDGSVFPNNTIQVWVHDFAAGTTVLASRGDGPAGEPANDDSTIPRISADGRVVAFDTDAALVPGLPANVEQVFRRALAVGTTSLASRGAGPGGPASASNASVNGITADGACVTFESDGSLFGPTPGATDITAIYLRAFATDCGRPPLSGGGGSQVRDTAAPVLRSVKLTRTRFRATRASSAAVGLRVSKIGRGTELRFISSEAGRLSVRIDRALPGRKSGKGRKRRCRVASHRVRHGGCTTFRKATTITKNIRAGRGKVKITGRIHRRKMPAGAYRLTVTARDKAGNVSRGIHRSFKILPG
jgi:Tol biopolymer transport system component